MLTTYCITNFTLSYSLPVSLFLAGLVGGFTHCAGMCGPFVLAQQRDFKQSTTLERLRGQALLPYHLGRMVTYVALAIVLNSILNLAFLFSDLRPLLVAPILMLAGVLFLVSAFPVFGKVFPWALKLQTTRPLGFVMQLSNKLIQSSNMFARFSMGVILGFMPCGLVLAALMASATAPTTAQAALAMGAFAFGTMPALILVGFGGHVLKKKYPALSQRFSQGAMAISAIWLFALAGFMVL